MLAKCSVFIATSLDGFISREDGSINWLMKANALVPPGEDGGYKSFISTVDGLVMGRHSNEITITIIPILLGRGRSLFGTLQDDIELHHIETRTIDCRFVQVKYRVEVGHAIVARACRD